MDGPVTYRVEVAGRLVEEKGLQVLLEAASGLGGAWRLQLVGSGDEIGQQLPVRVPPLPLDQSLRVAGEVAQRGQCPDRVVQGQRIPGRRPEDVAVVLHQHR